MTKIFEVAADIRQELLNAERKFPEFPADPIQAASIVQAEAGELVQVANQFTCGKGDIAPLYKKAIQAGAMGLRFLLNIDTFVKRPSEQVECSPNSNQTLPGKEDSAQIPGGTSGSV